MKRHCIIITKDFVERMIPSFDSYLIDWDNLGIGFMSYIDSKFTSISFWKDYKILLERENKKV